MMLQTSSVLQMASVDLIAQKVKFLKMNKCVLASF
jgi:hypothetical protein